MAPTSANPSVNRDIQEKNVIVPVPASGAAVAVESVPGGQLNLDFDPTSATASRAGNSLVFEVDGGGVVTVTDFFVVGDESLPDLRLPDGTVVASADFFEGSGLDMSTAAGPGAAPGSGGTSYDDDPGNLLAGVDKSGMLGTDYWSRFTETSEFVDGRSTEFPGGAGVFGIETDLGGGTIHVGAFEDGRPNQHLDGAAAEQHYAQLNFTFEATGTTVVDAVHLQGFHAGTLLYLGDPATTEPMIISGPDQVVDLTPAQFAAGVYLVPPANSSADMDITSTLDLRATASGYTTTVAGPTFVVIVDAVADRPEDIGGKVTDGGALEYHGTVEGSGFEREDGGYGDQKDGLIKDTLWINRGGDGDQNGVSVSVPITAEAVFFDYGENDPSDIGELHYVLIECPDRSWSCTVTAPDVDQSAVTILDNVPGYEGKLFFRIPVSNEYLQEQGGKVVVDAVLSSDSYYAGVTADMADGSFSLITGGMAVDEDTDGSLTTDNDVAYTFGETPINVNIDVIDAKVHVDLGWFSEGGDSGKHGNGAHALPPELAPGTNAGESAVVNVRLEDAGGDEFISVVTFTYDPTLGNLAYDTPAGWIISPPSLDPDTGLVTLIVNTNGTKPTNLDDMNMVFKPSGDNKFGDQDIPFDYRVTVVDNDSGATAVFGGSSEVRVDAVADLGAFQSVDGGEGWNLNSDGTLAAQYKKGDTAAQAGDTTTVKGRITFPDTDGSEVHYVVLNVFTPDNGPGGTLDNLWNVPGYDRLTQAEAYDVFRAAGGSSLPQRGLVPSANQVNPYILLELKPFDAAADFAGGGTQSYSLEVGGNTVYSVTVSLVGGNLVYSFKGNEGEFATVTYNPVSGTADFQVTMQAPNTNTDIASTVYAKGVSVETVPADGSDAYKGNNEYDYSNNIAVTDAEKITVEVDVVTTGLYVSFRAVEDNQATQNTEGETGYAETMPEFGLPITMQLAEVYPEGHAKAGQIIVESGLPKTPEDAGDYVSSLSFTLPAAGQGVIYYNGEAVTAENIGNIPGATLVGDTVTFTNAVPAFDLLSGFTFKPAEDWSGDVNLNITAEISSAASGAVAKNPGWELDADGNSRPAELHVDSVADQAWIDKADPEFDAEGNLVAGSGLTGRGAGGDAVMDANELEHKDGWSIQTSGESGHVRISFQISGTFTDSDGSESGAVYVNLPAGYGVPADLSAGGEYRYYTYDSVTKTYTEVAEPADATHVGIQLGQLGEAKEVGGISIDADGNYKGTLELNVAKGTAPTDLTVVVETVEQPFDAAGAGHSHGHKDENDRAVNTITEKVDVEYFSGSLTVKAGWVYEDNAADQHQGNMNHVEPSPGRAGDIGVALDSMAGDVSFSNTSISGAVPVVVAFEDPGANESLQSVTLKWDVTAGTLYNQFGQPLSGPEFTLRGSEVLGAGAKLYFVPKAGNLHSDKDIDLTYEAKFSDKGDGGDKNITFTVNGKVDIVVDAVADKAELVGDAALGYETGPGAAQAGEKVDITFTLQFAEDASETQFVLIPKGDGSVINGGLGGDLSEFGLTLINGAGLAAAVNNVAFADGTSVNGYYVYVVDPAYLNAEGKLTVTATVTTDKTLQGDKSETLGIKTVVVEGKAEDGTVLGNNKGLWESTWEAGKHLQNNDEYDFTNNVAVTDVPVVVNVGGIDTEGLVMGAAGAYEDNNPGQHTATPGDDSSAGSTITLSGLHGSEEISSVTFTFDPPEGTVSAGGFIGDVGSFKYGNVTYSVQNGGLKLNADGKVELTLTNYNPNSSASLTYQPGKNDSDADIEMSFTATVKDKASGATQNFDGKTTIVVDAVADRPVSGSGEVTGYKHSENGTGFSAADWGSTISVKVASTFTDHDGSEHHYLIIEARPGWSCGNADGIIMVKNPDTGVEKAYFYKLAGAGAKTGEHTFELTAPKDAAYDDGTIAGDGTVKLASGGLAVEGHIDANDDFDGAYPLTSGGATDTSKFSGFDYGKPTQADLSKPEYTDYKGDLEGTHDNNVALNTQDTGIKFNVISGGKGSVSGTFEDVIPGKVSPEDAANAHYDKNGVPTGTKVPTSVINGKDGTITIGVAKPAHDVVNDTIKGDVEITFSIKVPAGWTPDNGAPGTLGTFAVVGGGTLPAGCFSYAAGPNGTAVVTISVPNDFSTGKTGITLQYTPPPDQSTDLDNITYSMQVQSESSGASGTVTNGKQPIGSLVVDAVADRPDLAADSQGVDYGGKEAAEAGAQVTLDVGDITFSDYQDGSEAHFIVVQCTGISWSAENGTKGSGGSTTIASKQTIVITGDNGSRQEIDLAAKTITVYDKNGAKVEGAGRALTSAEYTAICSGSVLQTAPSTYLGGKYAMIPVLNEFLQLTEGGTVTATVDVALTSSTALTADGTYNIHTGGYAKETEVGSGISSNNDFAAELNPIPVHVNIVTSVPKITVADDHIFENLTPNAHLSADALQDAENALAAYKADPGSAPRPTGTGAVFMKDGRVLYEGEDGVLRTADNKVVDWMDAEIAPNDAPAILELSNIHKGEMVDITFSFAAKDGTAVPYDGGTVTMKLGAAELTVTIENGQVTFDAQTVLDTFGDLGGQTPVFEFRPPANYSHADISIECDVTVTDPVSGASTTWSTRPDTAGGEKQLQDADGKEITDIVVEVDAVAQAIAYEKPWTDANGNHFEIRAHGGVADGKGDGIEDDEVFSHVERGQNVYLDAMVNIGDMADGSQGLVLLVEATSAMLTPAAVTLGAFVDGVYKEFTVNFDPNETPQRVGNDGMFYKVEISAEILAQLSAAGVNTVDVRYTLGSGNLPGSMVSADIRVGAVTYEKSAEVVDPGKEFEAILDNNQSLVISETTPIQFDGKPTFSITADGWVSENDTPQANVGIDDKAGGTELNFNLNAEHTLSEFSLRVGLDPDGAPLGTILLNGQALPFIGATGQVDFSGVSFNPHEDALTFVPAHNNRDGEVALTYSGKVYNSKTGQTAELGGKTVEVIVDAVAQQPDVQGVQMWDDSTQGWVNIPNGTIPMKHDTKIGEGQSQSTGPLRISAHYPDADGSESHYALVKVAANTSLKFFNEETKTWDTCTETFFHKGVEYYKVPVYGEGNDKAVQVDITFDSRKLGIGHEDDALTIKAMAEENVSVGDGNKEKDYDNNIAVSGDGGDGGLVVDHQWPPGHVIWIDPAYENNTPDANLDDTNQEGQQPDESAPQPSAGQIYFGSIGYNDVTGEGGEPVTSAVIYVPKGSGVICDASGNPLAGTEAPDGYIKYEIGSGDLGNIYFIPDRNWSDSDVTITYEAKGDSGATATGSFPIVVDAVAQLPGVPDGEIAPDYSNADGAWTALGDEGKGGNEGVAKITIAGVFEDHDDHSEAHYALIEKKPGFFICDENGNAIDVETVYLPLSPNDPNGAVKAYYKVPMREGNSSVDVYVKATEFNADNKLPIKTGVMTVEEGHKAIGDNNYESDMSNNVSWNLEDGRTVVIEYSPVDTEITFKVNNIGENGEVVDGVHNGAITITVALGAHDVLNDLSITFNQNAGKIVWSGGECTTGTLNLADVLGMDFFTNLPADHKDASAAVNAALKDKLSFVTIGYKDTDTSLSIKGSVTDSRSGDTDAVNKGHAVIVDAVGHAPDVDGVMGVSASGNEAAKVGESYFAEATLTFQDVGSGEHHYAMLGQHIDWPCTKVLYRGLNTDTQEMEWLEGKLITFFDQSGKPYYAMAVEDGILTNGSVAVRFEVTAPATGKDVSNPVKIGGVSVDPNMGTKEDLELNLINNWEQNLDATVNLKVGVVDTDKVTGTSDNIDEVQGNTPESGTPDQGNLTKLEFAADAGSNDVVTGLVLTMPTDAKGNPLGAFWYDGVRYEGELTVTDFDPAKGPFFEPNEYWSGPVKITYTATVKDAQSGVSSEENAFSGSVEFVVNAVATTPVAPDLGADETLVAADYGDYSAAKAGQEVEFSVSAKFPDHDGSEQHYILIEKNDAWGAPAGNAGVYPESGDIDGKVYWKVPVPAGAEYTNGNVTVTISMTVPGGIAVDGTLTDGLAVGALAGEKNAQGVMEYEHAVYDETLNVDIAVVQADADDLTGPLLDTSEDTKVLLTFTLETDDADESITSVAIKAGDMPSGSTLWLQTGAGTFTEVKAQNGVYTLDGPGLGEGRYFFQPPADQHGDNMTLQYTVTVTDSKSGATGEITGTAEFSVTAFTDGGAVDGTSVTVTAEDVAGHSAGVKIQLSGRFDDTDGSEARFFLVSLPAGVLPPAGSEWEAVDAAWATAAGLTSPVYKVAVPEGHTAKDYTSGTFELKVTEDYKGGTGVIIYKAGSYEQTLYDAVPEGTNPLDVSGVVVISDTSNALTIQEGSGGLDYNLAPVAEDSTETIGDIWRTENPQVSGTLVMGDRMEENGIVSVKDKDGDTVTVAGVTGGSEVEETDTSFIVTGTYGVLTINKATGEYSYRYTVEGLDHPAAGTTETFNVTVTDAGEHLGDIAAKNAAASITITLNGANTAPTAAAQSDSSGGISREAFDNAGGMIDGTFTVNTNDAQDKGAVMTGATIVGKDGQPIPVGIGETVSGRYGDFTLEADGTYTYKQTNLQGVGEEDITVSFQEILYYSDGTPVYGLSGSGSLTIAVNGVNHAPVAESSVLEWDPKFDTQMGNVSFTDTDTFAPQNVKVTLIESAAGGKENVVEGMPVQISGTYGTLSMAQDGTYYFTLKEGIDREAVNEWDVFTYTVTDAGGLTAQAYINVPIGTPAVEPPSGFSADFLSAEIASPLDAAGAVGASVLMAGSRAAEETQEMSEGLDTFAVAEGASGFAYSGENSDVICAPSGMNLLDSSGAEDLFTWVADGFGAGCDTVTGFEITSGGLLFSDMFGNPESVDKLLGGIEQFAPNEFMMRDGACELKVLFTDINSLRLTITNGEEVQTIQVESEAGAPFIAELGQLDNDLEAAAALLRVVMSNCSS